MLTKTQKRTLANLVRQNQGILFSKFGPNVTRKKKEAIWEAIRQKLISLGAELPDVRYVRDFEWGNLKRAASKRCALNRMTELDQIVMSIVTGTPETLEDSKFENIEVTPTIYGNFSMDGSDYQDLNSGSNSGLGGDLGSSATRSDRTVTSKFSRILHEESQDDYEMTNGHSDLQDGQIPNHSYFPEYSDPELIFLQKQKLQLESDHLKLQMSEVKEKGQRDREIFRLESQKMRSEMEREKATTEKVKCETTVLKLKSKEIKARTEYFEAAKKSILEKHVVINSLSNVSEATLEDTDQAENIFRIN